jgi:hypothetical protein
MIFKRLGLIIFIFAFISPLVSFTGEKDVNKDVIEKSVDGGEDFSDTIFFGVSKFPIVMLEIQP